MVMLMAKAHQARTAREEERKLGIDWNKRALGILHELEECKADDLVQPADIGRALVRHGRRLIRQRKAKVT